MPEKTSTTVPIAAEAAGPGCRKSDPILVAHEVTRVFGGLKAVDVAHVEIPRGVITALIGPNGAGKTTLFNLLTGFDAPNEGDWNFDGKDLSGVPAYKVSRLGEIRTFQLTKVLGMMTVLENMKLGARHQKGEHIWQALFPFLWKSQEKEIEARALELLERFKLLPKKDDYAAAMSGGQRKLLEMARALMCDPQLIMLDEPMAGVNPALKQSLLEHIVSLKDDGVSVLFVEHDMHMVQSIADWVIVMAEGKVVAEGPPGIVMDDPAVVEAYLGSDKDKDLGQVIGEIRSRRAFNPEDSAVEIQRDETVVAEQLALSEAAEDLGEELSTTPADPSAVAAAGAGSDAAPAGSADTATPSDPAPTTDTEEPRS
ncbi:ABC transporter ATP-binding protein [Brachybacterium sp. AOP25-B2-12]|uniref:ABC transporter ATP-binding protein n=1 Tax=Brachybacterium sp. AOP25-B2-12 TaxID=3457710 RepID=UPI00403357F5